VIWFTSDQHYGHANIIDYCKRPFESVAQMNETLIANYCALVQPSDTVYFLGDCAFTDPIPFISCLPGQKFLVMGNHDWPKKSKLNRCGFGWIKDVYELEFNGLYIWLSHYPHRSWPRSHHGAPHFHGHCHGAIETPDKNTYDVGVDPNWFAPIGLDDILLRLG
jgi:calcineurin-like phosphoesterase family protein